VSEDEVMSDTVRAFFEDAAAKIDKTSLRGRRAYLFEVESVGTWIVKVDEGTLTVQEGDDDGAHCDCVITTSEGMFIRIAQKEQNPTLAYLTGKLKIRGNMAAASALLGEMKSHGLL
jgi:putative sterol carrier protein